MPSTHNNVWGQNKASGGIEELTLPSGQTCSAKKVGMEGLIGSGILAEADSLTAIASQHTKTKSPQGPQGAKVTELDQRSLLKDGDAVKAVIRLAEKALPSIVIHPPVALHYRERTVGKTPVQVALTEDERDEVRLTHTECEHEMCPGVIFTDQIDYADKMFLFEFGVGGLKAMTTFRPGSATDVAGVAAKPRPKNKAKRTSRG